MKILALSAATVAGVLALPAASFAATYAYVNTSGEVMSVEATSANQALMTAPNLAVHSGVMIIDSTDDTAVVGDGVSGI